jgi:hypothetical protein
MATLTGHLQVFAMRLSPIADLPTSATRHADAEDQHPSTPDAT